MQLYTSFESYGMVRWDTRRKSVYSGWLKATAETDLTLRFSVQTDNVSISITRSWRQHVSTSAFTIFPRKLLVLKLIESITTEQK